MSVLQKSRADLAKYLRNTSADTPQCVEPAEPPVLKNAFNRALMRRDVEFAQRAGHTLLGEDAANFWRHFARLAFGEFGVTSYRDISLLVAAASSKTWRRYAGGEWRVASFLLEKFLDAPHDRRISRLHSLATELRGRDLRLGNNPLGRQDFKATIHHAVSILLRCTRPAPHIGLVTIDALACEATFDEMAEAGVAVQEVLDICRQARRTTRSVKPVLFPLIARLSSLPQRQVLIKRSDRPEVVNIGGMPSYAYDATTKVGFFALKQLTEENRDLAAQLSHVRDIRMRQLLLDEALYVAEGNNPALELSFPEFDRSLRHLRSEFPANGDHFIADLKGVLRDQIPRLNELRQEIFKCL